MAANNEGWVEVQQRAFTRWANGFLSERMKTMKDLQTDLSDGRCLIDLLEVISSKPVGTPSKNPKSKFQKVENLNQALKFIASEGVKLVGIGAEDIHDGKLKLILGLIWTLILRFHINMGEGSPKWELLQWVRQQVKPYAVDEPNNFTKDWMDGKIISALVDSIEPGILTPKDMSGMTGNADTDVDKAMQVALDSYGIPRILDVSDMTQNPDELAMMTYVSYFREYLGEDARRKRDEHARKLRTADAAFCFADGPGLEGAETAAPAEFTIHARNCFDKELEPPHGGDAFAVDISKDGGAEKVAASIKDNGDGNYPVTYTATVPGLYSVSITLEGAPIKNSPYQVKVLGPVGANTTASGPGVEGTRTGVDSPIVIKTVDQDGNPVKTGGDKLSVTVSGPESVGNVPVKDNGDGTYGASYKVDTPGHYTVEIKVRDEPIKGSPFDVLVERGNAGNSWAEGPGLEGGKTDHEGVFTIHSVDADGKPAPAGGDPFVVKVTNKGDGSDVPATVTDNGDGTYTATYTPENPGDYEVAVTLHDQPIKDAPFEVTIKTAPDAAHTYADGPGLEDGQAKKPSNFVIHTVDKHGNPLTEGGDADELKATATGPAGELPVQIKDNGDGTYDAAFTPDQPGDYTVNVTYNDAPIKDMPAHVSIRAAPSAAFSYVDGPGIQETGVVDNEPTYFVVHLVDDQGAPLTVGGDKVDVEIKGPEDIAAAITDNQDGTYKVDYEPQVPGNYLVHVKVDDEPLQKSPFPVAISEGTDADNSGFGQFTFTIQSRDKRGNNKTTGGDQFDVEIKNKQDPDAVMESEAVDNGDGTYTAKYTLGGEGTFFIGVKLNGKSIKGSPFKQKL